MIALARSRCALALCAAAAFLAGCGGGGAVGSSGLPTVQNAVQGIQKADGVSPLGSAHTVIMVMKGSQPLSNVRVRIQFTNLKGQTIHKSARTDSNGTAKFWYTPNATVCALAQIKHPFQQVVQCASPPPAQWMISFPS